MRPVVCSSRVRHALTAGDVKQAAAWLGRPYCISGRVQLGAQRGRTIGFPTANIGLRQVNTPVQGVFAVTCDVDGKTVKGIANLGIRPTVDGQKRLLEVHLV